MYAANPPTVFAASAFTDAADARLVALAMLPVAHNAVPATTANNSGA